MIRRTFFAVLIESAASKPAPFKNRRVRHPPVE